MRSESGSPNLHNPAQHERAKELVDQSLLAALPSGEQVWLNRHLDTCRDCAAYAELSRRAVQALDHFSFDLDPAGPARVQNMIRARLASEQLHNSAQSAAWIAVLLTIAGSFAMWQLASWAAAQWRVPASSWQTGFAVMWLLPSLLLDAMILFRRAL